MPTDPRFEAQLSPVYQPAMRKILSITQTNPIVVTTTYDGITAGDNQYGTGLIVRLIIPRGFGMPQADGLLGAVTVIDSSSFSMPIDATFFDPFVIPNAQPGSFYTAAQVVPVGEINEILSQATRNVLPPLTGMVS